MTLPDGFAATVLDGVIIHRPRLFSDRRGRFHESWNRRAFSAAGITTDFVQDNVVVSSKAGTVRGLHFQVPPAAQAKLVFVACGAILDVAVDLRAGSATYGRHTAMTLSAASGEQIYIPTGFAHGYCSLADDTVVVYKVDAFWSLEHEGGLLWNDPALGIDWPVAPENAVIADRDRALPRLADLPRGLFA